MAALSRRVSRAAWVEMLVQPETILAWHRELVRKKWAAFGRRRGPGRPGLDAEIRNLILRIAKENPKWGCVRIRGELLKLGHVVSASAIRKLLRRNRIVPAPLRSPLSWKAFLRAQASAIVLTVSGSKITSHRCRESIGIEPLRRFDVISHRCPEEAISPVLGELA